METIKCFVACLIIALFLFSKQVKSQGFGYSSPELVVPIGHSGGIMHMEFSMDRKYILTASEDGTAKVWEGKSGKLIDGLKTRFTVT